VLPSNWSLLYHLEKVYMASSILKYWDWFVCMWCCLL
jgi:hypothetical protein